MKVIGLTGGIGMGKSTTAAMFAARGVPVWDADAAVHRLYAAGGAGVPVVARHYPDAVREGAVDREALRAAVLASPEALAAFEGDIHALVAVDRDAFLGVQREAGAKVVLIDVPLLFETGLDRAVDASVVVSAPPDVQRARVLARPGMTEGRLATILARQRPDADKRARADYIVETNSIEAAEAAVDRILAALRGD